MGQRLTEWEQGPCHRGLYWARRLHPAGDPSPLLWLTAPHSKPSTSGQHSWGSNLCSHRALSREGSRLVAQMLLGTDATCAGWRQACDRLLGVQQTQKRTQSCSKPPSPAQVRLPGLGELGAFCLLAAQCGCTSPPFGYRTNAGSEKGCWHSWQSFWSESQMALPLSFILSAA